MHRGYQGEGGRMRSNAIQFYSSNNTKVLRLSKDGITANPEIPVDEAAKLVLAAIDSNIKLLVQKAVEEEREANRQIALRKMRMLKDTERAHYKHTSSAFIPSRFGFDMAAVNEGMLIADAIAARGRE